MTLSQSLKKNLITTLTNGLATDEITIVDAKQRQEFTLPVLAVDVAGIESHSEVLQSVERIQMQCVFRSHAGDESETDVENMIGQIESILRDATAIVESNSGAVKIYSWIYGGSSQEWDENILDVTFSAEVLCVRI